MPGIFHPLRRTLRLWLSVVLTPAPNPRRLPVDTPKAQPDLTQNALPARRETNPTPIDSANEEQREPDLQRPTHTSWPLEGAESPKGRPSGEATAAPDLPRLASARTGLVLEVAQTLPMLTPEVLLGEDSQAPGATQSASGRRDGSRLPLVIIRLVLRPVDWVLHSLGPRYALYILFFRVAPPGLVAWLGKLRAVRAADRAIQRVPAYRAFLESYTASPIDLGRLRLPPTDKENYIKAYPIGERCLGGRIPGSNTAIDESSGSTGTPYNWIRSREERAVSHLFISHFARYCYGSDPWITINAFSMGAWATGINMGIALQHCSVVKNTGPDMDKIFSTLEFFGPGYEYLVCGYPPFLKHMIDVAQERDFPLERYRLMALLGGEGNSEGLRDYLHRRFQPVYSGYGATDIEIGLAGETPISVAIRREARQNRALRNAVFGSDSRLPMLFQYNPMMHHVVANEKGELVFTITRLNVLSPRIMYNVHDEGGVATYAEMRNRFRRAGADLNGLVPLGASGPLQLPFLWVYGRKDSTISVMGANIYPEDIEQCLYDEPDLAQVTHSFCLDLHEGTDGTVRPRFSFEVREEITPALLAHFEERIAARLETLNADFREAAKEYRDAVRPVIELFALGAGPFAGDAARIKQARLIKAESAR